MRRKKLSFTDHAWLRMDSPDNLMVITGLMTFDAPLKYEALKNTIEGSMLPIRRFRQRLVPPKPPFIRPSWEDDPNFNIESHLERVKIPEPTDQKALQEFISQLLSTGLDYDRPLWHCYLVENYGSGSAFIARIHHCIADGIALMQVLLSLTEPNPDSSDSDLPKGPTHFPSSPNQTSKSAFLGSEKWTVRNLWKEGGKILLHPAYARHRVRQVIDLVTTVGKLALRWPDPPTVFKGPLGIEKRAAWSEPIVLEDVKFIRKAFHCTVNDVLLTAVAGALGRYVNSREDPTRDISIRGFIPVNLRPLELDEDLGNKFGLVFLSMPIGIDDPIERLHRIKQNMDALKSSSEPVATFGVINLFGAVPTQLEEVLVDFFDTKGTTVITNVPGPQEQLYLAGAPINTIMAWVPQTGRIALGISIISYNSRVWLGVATDKGLVPDPEAIVDSFYIEYQQMQSRAQQVQEERQKHFLPVISKLDQAIQILDDLLAQTSKD
jgi:WS/DGAT/MGAT family acyltransferase